MRSLIMFATLLGLSAAVAAQTAAPPAPHIGQTVRDNNNMRVGTIDRVNGDGSLQLLVGMGFVTVPADKATVADGVVKLAMSKHEVERLH